jgi:hypothetical protein
MSKEDDDIKECLFNLEQAIRVQIEKTFDATDIRVTSQRSRFYKFYCFLMYGHLITNKSNVCLRCQKEIKIKTK